MLFEEITSRLYTANRHERVNSERESTYAVYSRCPSVFQSTTRSTSPATDEDVASCAVTLYMSASDTCTNPLRHD